MTNPTWHASPALLSAYAGGRSGPSDSWSLEAHLVDCAQCRAALALVLDPDDADLLAAQRTALLTDPPPQATRPARSTRRRHLHWLLRPGAALVVLAAVAAATVLDLLAPPSWPGLWVLAPVVPPLGVALSTWGEDDPAREAALATPSAGLRTTLWRTCLVVATALPLTALAGLLVGSSPLEFRWLLPSLATSAASLALGTLVPLHRAAVAVAAVWTLLVVVPQTPWLHPGSLEPFLLTARAQPLWVLVVLAAAAVTALRRDTFQLLPTRRNR